ncbi:hypothetical protein AAG906_012165 [Vitis piasezkii]
MSAHSFRGFSCKISRGLTYPFRFVGLLTKTDLGSRAWIRIEGRLYATVDQLTEITDTMASLRDAILGLVPPPPPPPVQLALRAGAFVLHGQTETTPHSIVALAQIVDDTQAFMGWDGYDDLLVAALPVEFRIPDIERLDEAQMIMLLSLSLSDAAQHWRNPPPVQKAAESLQQKGDFATLCKMLPSTWHDRISMISAIFNPALLSISGFSISRLWIIGSGLYGIEEGITRGLWADSSPSDSKRKKSGWDPCLLIYIRHRNWYMLHKLLRGHSFQRLVEGGLIVPLPPRPPPHPTPPRFRIDLHYAYHRRLVVPPPSGGVHLIEFSGDEIFMMRWDGEAPQPISLYKDLAFSGYIRGQQVSRPLRLIPNEIPR